MAWSTRELAELAGTSLRTVRHYHAVGLLPEPERRSNGYKQYGVAHLMRLLRVKRLADLGFSLAQIADLGDRDEHPDEALRALDADLAERIGQLQDLRAEIAEMLERGVPTDLPAELAAARDARLSAADRTIVAVMGRILDEDDRATYAAVLGERTPSDQEFDDLPADADEAVRRDLAERMATDVRALTARHPGVLTLGARTPVGPQRYRSTVARALADVYNPAQLDVLVRVRALVRDAPG